MTDENMTEPVSGSDDTDSRSAVFKRVRKKRFHNTVIDRSRVVTRAVLIIIIAICLGGSAFYFSQKHSQKVLNENLTAEAQKRAADAAEARAAAERAAAEDETGSAEETLREYTCPLDFDYMHETNDDIYAYIRIPDTKVNYPILQSQGDEPEDYYLDHNLDRSAGHPGCIYTQMIHSKDFTSPVTVLYGHNMKDGAMFATVHDFEDEDFFNDHPYVYVYTPDQELVYAAYAAYYYSDILIPYYFNYFESPSDLDYYLAEISLYGNKDDGHIRSGISPDNTSHIITLSTCNSTGSARYLLQCVLIDYLGDGAISDDDLADCSDEIRSGWRDAEPEWAVNE